MKKIITLFILFASINYIWAQDINSKTTKLSEEIIPIIKKYLPNYETETKYGRIYISYNTRQFMVHRPYKTGKWQNAKEDIGPEKGGIVLWFFITDEKYSGAAMIPLCATTDMYLFKETSIIKYSEKYNCYITAAIKAPRYDEKKELTKELIEILSNFENYL